MLEINIIIDNIFIYLLNLKLVFIRNKMYLLCNEFSVI